MGKKSDAVDRCSMRPVPVQNLCLNRIWVGSLAASLLRLDHHGSSEAGVVFHAPNRIAQDLKRYVDPGHMFMGMRIWVEVRMVRPSQAVIGGPHLFWLGMRLNPQDIVVTVQGSPL